MDLDFDIWGFLQNLGLTKCEEGSIWLNQHTDPSVILSYRFECLQMNDGHIFRSVYVCVYNREEVGYENQVDVDIYDDIEFSEGIGFDFSADYQNCIARLRQIMTDLVRACGAII